MQPVRFGGQQHIVEPFVTIKEIAPTFLLGKFWAGTLGKRCFGCGTPPTVLLAETHCEFGFLCCNTPRAVNNHFSLFWTENIR